jgi:hypothetical protein
LESVGQLHRLQTDNPHAPAELHICVCVVSCVL